MPWQHWPEQAQSTRINLEARMPDAQTQPDTSGPSKPRLAGAIPSFVIGQVYRRRDDIHLNYGGSWQNGISSSAVCPAIFLFTGDSGEQYGYKDGFDDAGVFSYSGEGQLSDMVFKAGNRSVRDHAKDGRGLYLFEEVPRTGGQRYKGEFALANYSLRKGPDREGKQRDIIVFHLMAVETQNRQPTDNAETLPLPPTTLNEARQRAVLAASGTEGSAGNVAVRTLYERSKAVRDYVLMRADGHCESCKLPAPFTASDGQPYLEAHHTTRLSDGGIDHPRHVAALCPTCHRRVHHGQGGSDINKLLVAWLSQTEAEQ